MNPDPAPASVPDPERPGADPRPTERDESDTNAGLGSAHRAGDGGVGADHGPAGGALVDWLLVAFVTLLCALTAVVGVAYLPWHLGSVPMPVSALLGVGAMVLAPRAAYRLTGSMAAAVLPVLVWFGVTVWLVLSRNPMMRSQALSVVQGQWRVMVLLGLGSLAAAATVTLLWAERTQARYAREQAVTTPATDPVTDPATGPAPVPASGPSIGPVAAGPAGGAPGRVEADEPTGRSG